MSTPAPQRVSVTVTPTFGDLYFGTLSMLRHLKMFLPAYLVCVACSLILFFLPYFKGRQPGLKEMALLPGICLFPFIITLVAVWYTRRYNRFTKGTFTFVFDAEGIHTSGTAFVQTLQWPLIYKIRQSKNYLFFFITPTRASCLPLRAFRDPSALDEVRALARQHTDFR